MANGSLSTSTNAELTIRKGIIEDDLLDCIVALPGQLFYTTQIPVSLWFVTRNKKEDIKRGYRNRTGEILFIDARRMGRLVDRVHRELTQEEIRQIADVYHAWKKGEGYEDKPGWWKSVTIEEIRQHGYVLTPGRYVGVEEQEDDGIPFEEKIAKLTATLYKQFEESQKLEAEIRKNLKILGYGGKIFNLDDLIAAIKEVHESLASQASRAVNISLTLRNWLIGAYIAEYELHGAERANYGDHLLSELSRKLRRYEISNSGRRQLYNYLAFYRTYPQIVRTVPAQFQHLLPEAANNQKVRTASAQLSVPPEKLVSSLSYSHVELLVAIDDELKRAFYEIECIRGNWSVRELKRQIASLYFERSELSRDKEKLAALVQSTADQAEPKLAIRDPYVFEFLGFKPAEVMSETNLEHQLLDKLQEFLLELGHGFCFEARQKRILNG